MSKPGSVPWRPAGAAIAPCTRRRLCTVGQQPATSQDAVEVADACHVDANRKQLRHNQIRREVLVLLGARAIHDRLLFTVAELARYTTRGSFASVDRSVAPPSFDCPSRVAGRSGGSAYSVRCWRFSFSVITSRISCSSREKCSLCSPRLRSHSPRLPYDSSGEEPPLLPDAGTRHCISSIYRLLDFIQSLRHLR
jgi:hypothetical protein